MGIPEDEANSLREHYRAQLIVRLVHVATHAVECGGCKEVGCAQCFALFTHLPSECPIEDKSCSLCRDRKTVIMGHAMRCSAEECAIPHCASAKVALEHIKKRREESKAGAR